MSELRTLYAAIALSPGDKARITLTDGSMVIIQEIIKPDVRAPGHLCYRLSHIRADHMTSICPGRNFGEIQDKFEMICLETSTPRGEQLLNEPVWFSI